MALTRVIHLRDEDARRGARNANTCVIHIGEGLKAGPACEVAFLTAYDTLRQLWAQQTGPGLIVLAVDEDGVACSATFRAKSRSIQTAIVGRHTRADVYLPSDDTISLRHLAIVLHPHTEGERVRYRVLDLRTSTAFRDERGLRVEHLAADGPLFVHLGSYALLMVPTGDPDFRWPADPLAAWKGLPRRTYSVGEAGQRPRARLIAGGPRDRNDTGVQLVPGPQFAVRGLASEDEATLGELRVDSDGASTSFLIGRSAARGGVLLGRYDRCDSSGLPTLQNHQVSRVHVLLLEVDDVIYVIDTASTNGLWTSTTGVRQQPLRFGDALELGRGLASIRWSAVH